MSGVCMHLFWALSLPLEHQCCSSEDPVWGDSSHFGLVLTYWINHPMVDVFNTCICPLYVYTSFVASDFHWKTNGGLLKFKVGVFLNNLAQYSHTEGQVILWLMYKYMCVFKWRLILLEIKILLELYICPLYSDTCFVALAIH